jgi:hypothetical protein
VIIDSPVNDLAGLAEIISHSWSDANPEFHVLKLQMLNFTRNHGKVEQFYRHALRKLPRK